jgi:hypothetical protein
MLKFFLWVFPIQVSPQNGEMKVLLSKFHLKTSMTGLIWGPKAKLHDKNIEIWNSKSTSLIQISNFEDFSYIVCNMRKVCKRPTSTSDFFNYLLLFYIRGQ